MVIVASRLKVIDNSGVKLARCLKVLRVPVAKPGTLIVVSVQKVLPKKKITKGDVLFGLVVSLRGRYRRLTGEHIKSDRNGLLLVKKKEAEPLANRIFFPIYNELRFTTFTKIISIAKDIV